MTGVMPCGSVSHAAARRAAQIAGTLEAYDACGRAIAELRRRMAAESNSPRKSEYLEQLAALARERRALLPPDEQLRALEAVVRAEQAVPQQGATACG